MNGRSLDDRDMDDIDSPGDFRLAGRFYSMLKHPDCPVHMFDFEAKQLSRHLAIKYTRTHVGRPRGNGGKGRARIGMRENTAWG